MDTNEIQKQLTLFTKRVRSKIKTEKVIVYGSYAQGQANEYSDVDVLVISPSFKNMNPDERFHMLYSITTDIHPDFQVQGATPEEIQKASPYSTLAEALRTGTSI